MKKTIKLIKCHCGKNGHALNSINCPVHKPIKAWMVVDENNKPLDVLFYKPTKYTMFSIGSWTFALGSNKVIPVLITSK